MPIGSDYRQRSSIVRIIALQFLTPAGELATFGGAERYLIELSRVIRELGYGVEVFQPAHSSPWVAHYQGMRVIGVDVEDSFAVESTVHPGDLPPALTVHLAFYTAGPSTVPPAIGISHGVYWDDPYYHVEGRLEWHRDRILNALEYLDVVVSVDTNTINWISAMNPRLAERCVFVPNFVDLTQFAPPKDTRDREQSTCVILFPRRLVVPRGFWLMAEIIPGMLKDFPMLQFHFAGHAAGKEEEEIRRLVAEYPQQVRWETVPFEGMPELYRQADIVVIPTLSAEGTALACLEAQATGKPVVATRIGGLPNLILNGYNGLLVEPRATAVRAGLERLIRDPRLRQELGNRSLETVRVFSIERWRERWRDLLRTFLRPSAGAVHETQIRQET